MSQRAIERNELRAEPDQELMRDLPTALLYWRLVVTKNFIAPDNIDAITALTVAGLTSR